MKSNFYTFNTYLKNEENLITATMEDYIEMIYRLSEKEGFTRVGDLSKALNVQPPSISKMIKKAGNAGYDYFSKVWVYKAY